jgi:hypothetical protein
MQTDDLRALADEDLCALEGHRSLEPSDWRRIDDELRRRRRSRVTGLADLPGGPPAETMPTLGDLERVASELTARLAATEREVRRLRWWVLFSPVIWALVAGASLLATRSFAPELLQRIGL